MPSNHGTSFHECKQFSSHDLRAQAETLRAKAKTHARHAILAAERGFEHDADDYNARSESEAHTASMLFSAAHQIENPHERFERRAA